MGRVLLSGTLLVISQVCRRRLADYQQRERGLSSNVTAQKMLQTSDSSAAKRCIKQSEHSRHAEGLGGGVSDHGFTVQSGLQASYSKLPLPMRGGTGYLILPMVPPRTGMHVLTRGVGGVGVVASEEWCDESELAPASGYVRKTWGDEWVTVGRVRGRGTFSRKLQAHTVRECKAVVTATLRTHGAWLGECHEMPTSGMAALQNEGEAEEQMPHYDLPRQCRDHAFTVNCAFTEAFRLRIWEGGPDGEERHIHIPLGYMVVLGGRCWHAGAKATGNVRPRVHCLVRWKSQKELKAPVTLPS